MLSLQRWFAQCIENRLLAAEQNLRLVAGLDQLHARASSDLAHSGAALLVLVRIYWRAFCIERCAHHAARAAESRR
jgi:hypothetical protein